MYVTHSEVRAQHRLGAKRRCLIVEVVGCPGVDGGRSSSDGRRDKCLLAKAKYVELVGDEVQACEEEGLGQLEDGRNPRPNRWEHGKLQRAEASHIA